MLDFYSAHTIQNGPAMTASMQAIVAAKLGRGQESLDQFHDSYRPFMRGPWDAFAEKRTSNRVYFCTGMGGCLQSVLYGFAGLQVVEAGQKAAGTKIAGDSDAVALCRPAPAAGVGRADRQRRSVPRQELTTSRSHPATRSRSRRENRL